MRGLLCLGAGNGSVLAREWWLKKAGLSLLHASSGGCDRCWDTECSVLIPEASTLFYLIPQTFIANSVRSKQKRLSASLSCLGEGSLLEKSQNFQLENFDQAWVVFLSSPFSPLRHQPSASLVQNKLWKKLLLHKAVLKWQEAFHPCWSPVPPEKAVDSPHVEQISWSKNNGTKWKESASWWNCHQTYFVPVGVPKGEENETHKLRETPWSDINRKNPNRTQSSALPKRRGNEDTQYGVKASFWKFFNETDQCDSRILSSGVEITGIRKWLGKNGGFLTVWKGQVHVGF